MALALKLLRRRDYSRRELTTRLTRRFDFDPASLLDWLESKDYLSDRRFAAGFVRSHRHWARGRVDAGLEALGIEAGIRHEVLDLAEWPSLEVIVKDRMKRMRLAPPLDRSEAARIAGALARAGYDPAEVGDELEKLL